MISALISRSLRVTTSQLDETSEPFFQILTGRYVTKAASDIDYKFGANEKNQLRVRCWLASPSMALAQAVAKAQMHGVVTDASGAAVPSAQIKATQTERARYESR